MGLGRVGQLAVLGRMKWGWKRSYDWEADEWEF